MVTVRTTGLRSVVILMMMTTMMMMIGCSRALYTEIVTPSMTKLYIRETHNKHAGPYRCAARDELQQTVAHATIRLLLYSMIIVSIRCTYSFQSCTGSILAFFRLQRDLSRIPHRLEWYKLVLRIRLFTPTVRCLVHTGLYTTQLIGRNTGVVHLFVRPIVRPFVSLFVDYLKSRNS